MGREIRRVPLGWEHPKTDNGDFQPLYDETFEDFARQWHQELELWLDGKHPDQLEGRNSREQRLQDELNRLDAIETGDAQDILPWERVTWGSRQEILDHYAEESYLAASYAGFLEWVGGLGDSDYIRYYRPEWDEHAVMGYAVYETVSEGTPVSPTFSTLQEIEQWLIGEGYSRDAAATFIEVGFVSTFVGSAEKGIVEGIEALSVFR